MSRFLKFLAQDPQNLNLLLAISKEYRESGHYSESQQFLEQALSLAETQPDYHPLLSEVYALKAQLYFDSNQAELARQSAMQALQIDPDNYLAQVILGLSGLENGTTTCDEIEQLMRREPEDSRLWFASGILFFRELKFQQAEKAHLKAAELDPYFYENWISLAWCQLFLDKLQNAKTNYQQAIFLHEQGGAEPWGGLALIHALNAEFSEAEQLIEKAKTMAPDCFLVAIAELICSNHCEPKKTMSLFNQCMPKAGLQINAAMEHLLVEMDARTNL